jgi:alpha-N-acetylglucosaminidase
LLATHHNFLLGRWLENAKRWGTTDAERNRLEWNARRVLTLWGQTTRIDDYARKDWAGMVGGYYLHRWHAYFDHANEALKQDRPFDADTCNEQLRKWMIQWSEQREQYPTEPRGSSVAVANRLWHQYRDAFKPGSLHFPSVH